MHSYIGDTVCALVHACAYERVKLFPFVPFKGAYMYVYVCFVVPNKMCLNIFLYICMFYIN